MAHKYPLTKPMLLLKSDVEVNGKDILVKMHIKGADFLRAKRTDRELVKVLKNLFGIDYTVELTEDVSREEIEEIKRRLDEEEAKIIAHMEEEHSKMIEEEVQLPEAPIPEEYIPENIEGVEENIEYIMGKPSKAKEKHISVKELSADSGRVTLEGRIITSEVRETKSGKGMLIFDIYDGTGRITIKSFAKDIKEGREH